MKFLLVFSLFLMNSYCQRNFPPAIPPQASSGVGLPTINRAASGIPPLDPSSLPVAPPFPSPDQLPTIAPGLSLPNIPPVPTLPLQSALPPLPSGSSLPSGPSLPPIPSVPLLPSGVSLPSAIPLSSGNLVSSPLSIVEKLPSEVPQLSATLSSLGNLVTSSLPTVKPLPSIISTTPSTLLSSRPSIISGEILKPITSLLSGASLPASSSLLSGIPLPTTPSASPGGSLLITPPGWPAPPPGFNWPSFPPGTSRPPIPSNWTWQTSSSGWQWPVPPTGTRWPLSGAQNKTDVLSKNTLGWPRSGTSRPLPQGWLSSIPPAEWPIFTSGTTQPSFSSEATQTSIETTTSQTPPLNLGAQNQSSNTATPTPSGWLLPVQQGLSWPALPSGYSWFTFPVSGPLLALSPSEAPSTVSTPIKPLTPEIPTPFLPSIPFKPSQQQRNETIERPCEIFDIYCIRRFFADHANCKEMNRPVPDPLYRAQSPIYLPRINLTIISNNVIYRGLNGRISEFYINRDTDNLILAIEFRNLAVESDNTYFRFHRRGQEPIVNNDFLNIKYSSLESTIIIPNLDDLELERSEVFTYINDASPQITIGPNAFLSSDPDVAGTLLEFLADIPTNIKEKSLTRSPFCPATYIQYTICDFGLQIL